MVTPNTANLLAGIVAFIVITVPPAIGPRFGDTSLMTGNATHRHQRKRKEFMV
jgi:hypothetical protein